MPKKTLMDLVDKNDLEFITREEFNKFVTETVEIIDNIENDILSLSERVDELELKE